MTDELLHPLIDEDGAPFWEASLRSELVVQACAACGKLRHPPRPMCPHCRSTDVAWKTMSGRGTVWSFVVAHPPLLPAYQARAPYNVVIVALDEDPTIRLTGNLVTSETGEINEIDPSTIEIGMPVRAVFAKAFEDAALLRWVVA
jgi:uncharacterized OB-fold protein